MTAAGIVLAIFGFIIAIIGLWLAIEDSSTPKYLGQNADKIVSYGLLIFGSILFLVGIFVRPVAH